MLESISLSLLSFELIAGETRNMDLWPFLTPYTVYESIEESFDPNYQWLINLGSYASDTLNTKIVQLDNVSILQISYFYNGVFYEDETVQDDPYDGDDIPDVLPGTTEIINSIWDQLGALGDFMQNLNSWIRIILIVLALLVVLFVFSSVSKIVQLIAAIFNLVFTTIKFIVKYTWKLLKFIVIEIPKGIINVIIFLVIPSEKRKERNYRANRYI